MIDDIYSGECKASKQWRLFDSRYLKNEISKITLLSKTTCSLNCDVSYFSLYFNSSYLKPLVPQDFLGPNSRYEDIFVPTLLQRRGVALTSIRLLSQSCMLDGYEAMIKTSMSFNGYIYSVQFYMFD